MFHLDQWQLRVLNLSQDKKSLTIKDGEFLVDWVELALDLLHELFLEVPRQLHELLNNVLVHRARAL